MILFYGGMKRISYEIPEIIADLKIAYADEMIAALERKPR